MAVIYTTLLFYISYLFYFIRILKIIQKQTPIPHESNRKIF